MTPNSPILAPSILAGNHANLSESLKIIEDSGAPWVHLDIMDGHFVPNLSFGPKVVADLRKISKLFFDTHLMLDNPQKFIEPFAKAGSNNLTIHVEPDYDIKGTLKEIRKLGCTCGLSLNPGTAVESLLPYLNDIDLVLVMSVQPGYGGQEFREDVLEKIGKISEWKTEKNLDFRIEVDGGIDQETAKLCYAQGADTFVSGTAFFKAKDKKDFLKDLSKKN